MNNVDWFKSSYSGGNGGSCVEVRRIDGVIQMRDTKADGKGPNLAFTQAEFAAFVNGAKAGEFDLLVS